jgi:hypothetical protein
MRRVRENNVTVTSINKARSVTNDHFDVGVDDVADVDESSTASARAKRKEKTLREKNIFAKRETRNINRLRAIAMFVLGIATLSVAIIVFFKVRYSENIRFYTAYYLDAEKVLLSMGYSIQSNLGVMDSFASTILSFAKQTNQTFPNVTIPNFAIKASKLLTLSAGFQISLQPVVTADQRLGWEEYAVENQWWVNQTKYVQDIDPFFYDEVNYSYPIPTMIWNYTGTIPYDPK